MKPTGRIPNPKFILTVSSVVIAAFGFTATILFAQDSLDVLRQAAEQGDAAAQFDLGVKYSHGRGVPEDDAEGMRWYRKAAEQGHADAQYRLAVGYALGRGVAQDDTEAARWMQKAAEQGHAVAHFSQGVSRDGFAL